MTNNPMTNKKQLLVAAGLAALSSGVLAKPWTNAFTLI